MTDDGGVLVLAQAKQEASTLTECTLAFVFGHNEQACIPDPIGWGVLLPLSPSASLGFGSNAGRRSNPVTAIVVLMSCAVVLVLVYRL
jgi:hypothetical protein